MAEEPAMVEQPPKGPIGAQEWGDDSIIFTSQIEGEWIQVDNSESLVDLAEFR